MTDQFKSKIIDIMRELDLHPACIEDENLAGCDAYHTIQDAIVSVIEGENAELKLRLQAAEDICYLWAGESYWGSAFRREEWLKEQLEKSYAEFKAEKEKRA